MFFFSSFLLKNIFMCTACRRDRTQAKKKKEKNSFLLSFFFVLPLDKKKESNKLSFFLYLRVFLHRRRFCYCCYRSMCIQSSKRFAFFLSFFLHINDKGLNECELSFSSPTHQQYLDINRGKKRSKKKKRKEKKRTRQAK